MTVDFSFIIRRVLRQVFLASLMIVWLGGAASCVFASQSVELTWNPSTDPDVVSYNVYSGTQSHKYIDTSTVGDVTDVTIPGLTDGTTYYFAVTAVDDQGNESAFSNEAIYNVPPPSTLTLQIQGTTAALQSVAANWTPSDDDDVYGYVVECGTKSGVYTNSSYFYYVTNGIISGLTGGTKYYFSVFPIDSLGIETVGSVEVSYTVPADPPLVLHAAPPLGAPGVELTWNASTDDAVVGYNLYYGTASHSYSYNVSCGNVTDYILEGLTAGQIYYFAVGAVDAYGNEGPLSAETICVAVAPAPLVAQVQDTTAALEAANVAWTPSPDVDVYGYVVYYGTQSGVYANSQYVFGVTNQLIAGLAGGSTNYFAIASIDAYGVEPIASKQVACVVPPPKPIVLTGNTVTNTTRVKLNWNMVPNEGIINYTVYYDTQSGAQNGGYYSYGTSFGATNNVVITGLAPNQTYYFAVAGQDAYGNQTTNSNEVAVTTLPPGPMVLQLQTYYDGNGMLYLVEVNTDSSVTGPWELDYSTDMQTWNYYVSGYGSGNGDGYDVDAFFWVDSTMPQMYFRVVNN